LHWDGGPALRTPYHFLQTGLICAARGTDGDSPLNDALAFS
jgi:hypothetical protein